MANFIKKGTYLRIDFSDGKCYETSNCTEDLFQFVAENCNNEEILKEKLFYTKEEQSVANRLKNSKILIQRGASVYMKGVNELSIPSDFVEKILDAEESLNEAEINKYKNFWTLVGLNPDSRVCNNIFWFIRRWDMQIAPSGLIIAYRNVEIKDEGNSFSTEEAKDIIEKYYTAKYIDNVNPDNLEYKGMALSDTYKSLTTIKSPVYTDNYTHTFEIKIGQPVSMPREECDCVQENSCSKGLHVGAKGWLKDNYCGNVGIQCLVSPADVVAVPTIDNYGKMRCCRYLPVAIISYDNNGNVIEPPYDLSKDIEYLKNIQYDGKVNNNDVNNYTVVTMYQNREELYTSILNRLNGIEHDNNEEDLNEEE